MPGIKKWGLITLAVALTISTTILSDNTTSPIPKSQEISMPIPKLISFDPESADYVKLLGGPPDAVTMHSGLVVLDSGKSVGTHNTENYEEVLVVLEGNGTMQITGGEKLELGVGRMAYCPPHTEHNVTSTGPGMLRYIYIVADAEHGK